MTHSDNITEKILGRIKSGEVAMRPKAYFAGKLIILACLATLVLITSVLLVSFTLFSIIATGHLLLLGFGWRGLLAFMALFPWTTFCVDIVLVFLLDMLFRRFEFGYRRSVVFLFLATAVILVLVGYAVSATSFHGRLLRRAERHELPIFGGLYTGLRRPHRDQGVFQGTVTAIGPGVFILDRDEDNDEASTTRVIVPPGVDISSYIQVGDHVLVGGTLTGGEVQAYGFRKFVAEPAGQ
jgi:hypothetical protein